MALERRREVINIDVAEDYSEAPIWAVQGEHNSLELDIRVTQKGKPIDLTDTKFIFKARRTDGYIERVELTDGSSVVVIPESLFWRDGEVSCDVTIHDIPNRMTVKTPIFKMHVLASIMDDE